MSELSRQLLDTLPHGQDPRVAPELTITKVGNRYRITPAGKSPVWVENLADVFDLRKFRALAGQQIRWSPQSAVKPDAWVDKINAALDKRYSEEADPADGRTIPFGAHRISALEQHAGGETEEHIVGGYLVRGNVTMLAAAAKTGKTTFIFDAVRAIVTGEKTFCGRVVKQARVFHVDLEMGPRKIVRWAKQRDLDTTDSFRAWSGRRSAIEDGTLRAALTEAKSDVLIVDSWSKWTASALGDGGEGNNPVLTRELTALIAIARELNIAILLVHHLRKAPGSFGEVIRGGGANFENVDIAIVMKRKNANDIDNPARQLEAEGRFNFEETPEESTPGFLEVVRVGGVYAVGNASELPRGSQLDPWPRWLLLTCPDAPRAWGTWKVAKLPNKAHPAGDMPSESQLQRYRTVLVERGLVTSPKRGQWQRAAEGKKLADAIERELSF
jgi:hypothetical protein